MINKRFRINYEDPTIVIKDHSLKKFWFMRRGTDEKIYKEWVEVVEQLVDLLNEINEYNKSLIIENGILLNEIVRLIEDEGAKTSDYFNEQARELYGEDLSDII